MHALPGTALGGNWNLTKLGDKPDKLAGDAAGALGADGDKTGKQLKDAAENATKVLNASVHKIMNDKLNPNVTSDKGKLATLATKIIDSNFVSRFVANDVLGKKSSDAGTAAVNFTHVAAQNSYSLPIALMNAKTAQGQADVKKSAKDLLDSNFVTREIIKAGGGTVTSVADDIGGTVAPIGATAGPAALDDKNPLRQAVNTTVKGVVDRFLTNGGAFKPSGTVPFGKAVKGTSAYLTTQMRDKWASHIKGAPRRPRTPLSSLARPSGAPCSGAHSYATQVCRRACRPRTWRRQWTTPWLRKQSGPCSGRWTRPTC